MSEESDLSSDSSLTHSSFSCGVSQFVISRLKGAEDTSFKTNLAIYNNDTLVVTGTSYFLWVMDNFKEISSEVRRVWEEDNKVVEDLGAEEESQQETLEESGRCCELEYNKVKVEGCMTEMIMSRQLSDRLLDLDNKMTALADTLHLMLPSQNQLKEISGKSR